MEPVLVHSNNESTLVVQNIFRDGWEERAGLIGPKDQAEIGRTVVTACWHGYWIYAACSNGARNGQ